MARSEINIFYIISFLCSILLIGYIWLVFLPAFENSVAYDSIRNVAFLVTALLLVSAAIQIFLAVIKERPRRP
ncbi:hypothetical protein CW705_07560 [Candidatus Bathyarchaeota archaeon]|nr:MAG: hypothetical protein CW705_07560 [Candidatus Bathyarchaeota archaeon]